MGARVRAFKRRRLALTVAQGNAGTFIFSQAHDMIRLMSPLFLSTTAAWILAQPASPVWSAPPQATYPHEASDAGITSGAVRLRCAPVSSGALSDCVIQSEEPPGFGFGEAALASTQDARLNLEEGRGLQPFVEFNISFRLTGDVAPRGESDAALDCEVLESGAVTDCRIIPERSRSPEFARQLLTIQSQLSIEPLVNWRPGQRTTFEFYQRDPE